MNTRFRLLCYFCAAFFPAFATAARNAHAPADWSVAIALAAGAGFTSLVAYFDHSEITPPPPGVPV